LTGRTAIGQRETLFLVVAVMARHRHWIIELHGTLHATGRLATTSHLRPSLARPMSFRHDGEDSFPRQHPSPPTAAAAAAAAATTDNGS